MAKKIKVLVIDDSALIRDLLTSWLNDDSEIEVVGTAPDPYIARDKIKKLEPDVLTLDVEMPRMDGLTFLRNLMRLHPMPVVMVSSLTQKGADVTLQALEIGAVDYVPKPVVGTTEDFQENREELVEKVKMAAQAKVRPGNVRVTQPKIEKKHDADAIIKKRERTRGFSAAEKIIAIGASTGGTEAIKEVLVDFPTDCPGVVIAQHIPGNFSGTFAMRVDSLAQITVKEAQDKEIVRPGHAYIAPGGLHLLVERNGSQYRCRLNDGPRVNRHRPSVDVLFRSVCQEAGPEAIGVILTGMGDDGANGLMEMKTAGAPTVAQDEQTSVVWGMPGAAHKIGAVDSLLPLNKIAGAVVDLYQHQNA